MKMKTSDLKQTAFVGIVATAALGVGTTFTQTTASADSLETPVVNAGTNQNSTTHAEPTNLAEANANLKQIEHSYQDATAELTNAQTTLNTAINAQNSASQAVNDNAKVINETNTQIASKSTELSQAKDVSNAAQTEANLAKETLDNEIAKHPTADEDLRKAEVAAKEAAEAKKTADNHEIEARNVVNKATDTVSEIKGKVSNELKVVNNLVTEKENRAKALDEAREAHSSAENKLSNKQSEVASETARLQSIFDNTPNIVNSINAIDYERQSETKDGTGVDNTDNHEIFLSAGKETVDITLTPEQQLEYDQTGVYTYTPNAKKITQYMVDYINRLRDINGIPGHLTANDSELLETARLRAKENDDRDMVTHYSELGRTRQAEIAKGTIYAFRSNFDIENNSIVLSDQQMAYQELSSWFSDYRNLVKSENGDLAYGHRNALLFMNGNFAYGYAQKKKTTESYHTDNGQAIGVNLNRNGSATNKDAQQKVTYQKGDDGRTYQYYDGKRVTFLPEITFNYISTSRLAPKKQEAKDNLDSYKVTSADEIKAIETDLIKAKDKVKVANDELSKAILELASHEAHLKDLESQFENASKVLEDSKVKLAEAAKKVSEANESKEKVDKALSEAKAVKQLLINAKVKLTEALNKVSDSNNQVQKVQTELSTMIASRDALVVKQNELVKAYDNAKTTVERARAAYDKAKIRVEELTSAYVKAQADVLKFTPKPVAKSKPGSQFVNIKYYGDSNLLYSSSNPVQSSELKAYKNQTSTSPKCESGNINSMSVNRQTQLPSTGDESSILTTMGITIMSLFGLLYTGKHRKNTN